MRHAGRVEEAAVVLGGVAREAAVGRATRMMAAFELGLSLCYAGRPDAAAEAVDLLDSLHDPSDPSVTSARRDDLLALQHLVAGRYDAAAEAAERAMELYADSTWSDVVGYVQNVRGLSRLCAGALDSAASDFLAVQQGAAAIAQDRLEALTSFNLAWTRLRLADTAEAAAAADRAANRLRSCGTDGVDSAEALAAAAHGQAAGTIPQLLEVAATAGQRNPDFYAPTATVLADVQAILERHGRSG
jgi:tetratricopeptide (TPR) repeat protein